MEHGSIITQARREDALVLTKQGRGSNFPKLCVAPGRGGGWHISEPASCLLTSRGSGQTLPNGPPGPPATASLSVLRSPWGGSRGPRPLRPRGRGVNRAAVTPSCNPSPLRRD
jgi:hypothetical protein